MDESNSQRQQKIVIVEDNVSLAEIYKVRLEAIGYTIISAYDGEAALQSIETEMPDLVLLDLMVPKIAGDQILARMRATPWGANIKVYIISNISEADAPAGLRNYNIEGYAVKANLAYDNIDRIVDDILRPGGQPIAPPVVADQAPVIEVPEPTVSELESPEPTPDTPNQDPAP